MTSRVRRNLKPRDASVDIGEKRITTQRREGRTIRRIREGVLSGKLSEPFSPAELNRFLGIRYAGTFLPRHSVGNTRTTELFERVSSRPALYRLFYPPQAEEVESMEPTLGQIQLFPYNFAPKDWAFCEGQLLPISSNSALYSLIGTQFGGDGRTTFALPDMRGNDPVPNTRYCIALTGEFPSRS